MDRNTLNIILLSLAFFFIFVAFFTQNLIEEVVINSYSEKNNINKHAGYYSLVVIYAVFTIANFFALPIVRIFNAKWTMVLGAIFYATFLFRFLFLNEICLYIFSALLGCGAAALWCGQAKYFALNCTSETAGKLIGIFFGIHHTCLAFGGIFLYFLFMHTGNGMTLTIGAIRIIYGVFAGVTLLGIIFLILLPMPNSNLNMYTCKFQEMHEEEMEYSKSIKNIFKLFFTRRMLFASVAFAYSGVELSFWSGIYPTCVAFTKKLDMDTTAILSLIVFFVGLGHSVGGFISGIANRKFAWATRANITIIGSIMLILVYITVFLHFPKESSLQKTDEISFIYPSAYVSMICSFFLGFGDVCWKAQLTAFCVVKYPGQTVEAFSLFMFLQSLLTCASFFYGTIIDLYWHIIILVVGALIGTICFVVAENIQEHSDLIKVERF